MFQIRIGVEEALKIINGVPRRLVRDNYQRVDNQDLDTPCKHPRPKNFDPSSLVEPNDAPQLGPERVKVM